MKDKGSMNKTQRIRLLDGLLKHHQGYTILDLMALLDVGERTIRNYLEQIQQPPYNAKFWNKYRGKERVYRYLDINYSLPLFQNHDEVKKKLDTAIRETESLKGTPQYEWLRLCLMAIEGDNVFGVSNVMSFDNNEYLKGIEYLRLLSDAIINKHPIKLEYQPYGAKTKTLQVHPYHLKQYNNRWFLIGQPDNIDGLHNYAIDRIKSVSHLSKPYIDTDIDFQEYFDDVIGVSVNDKPVEEVVLMVNKNRYPYIKTKPLHWSQRHCQDKDSSERVCLVIKVIPNRELITLLLSYGSDIEVISPDSIRAHMFSIIDILYKSYTKRS